MHGQTLRFIRIWNRKLDTDEAGFIEVRKPPGGLFPSGGYIIEGDVVKLKSVVSSGILLGCLGMTCYSVCFADCGYNDSRYPEHALTCQSGLKYQCEDGTWIDVGVECQDRQGLRTYEDYTCSCTDDEVNNCIFSGQTCVATQQIGGCSKKCVE